MTTNLGRKRTSERVMTETPCFFYSLILMAHVTMETQAHFWPEQGGNQAVVDKVQQPPAPDIRTRLWRSSLGDLFSQ